jgi:hypothetical protein
MGWRGFGFVHHSIAIFCRAVPNPSHDSQLLHRRATQDREAQCVKRWHLPSGVVTTVAGSMSGFHQSELLEPVYTRGLAGAIEVMQVTAHPLPAATFQQEVGFPEPHSRSALLK